MKKPINIEAERAVLAAAIVDGELAGDIIDLEFTDNRNADLAGAVKTLYLAKKEIDFVGIKDVLNQKGKEFDGEYLLDIVSDVTAPASFKHHLKILRETNEARRTWDILSGGLKVIGGGKRGITDSIIQELIGSNSGTSDYTDIETAAQEALDHIEEGFNAHQSGKPLPFGIPCGIYELDKYTNGFQEEDLIIIAARPGEGKTALANQLLYNMSIARKDKKRGLLLSLEMTRKQNVIRMISMQSGIENYVLFSGRYDRGKHNDVVRAVAKTMEGKCWIGNLKDKNLDTIISLVIRAKARFDIDYVIIDYLQLAGIRNMREYERVSEVVSQFKGLAKSLKIPIIVPCQLSRTKLKDISRSTAKDTIENPQPMLSDLRGSGNIEQDASIVIFVHWYSIYKNIDVMPDTVPGEIVLAKNRSGPTTSISMDFERKFLRFKI